jgi:hypothetical protein
MSNANFSVNFLIRKKKLRKDGKNTLFLRLTVNGRRWDHSLNIGINPDIWDSKMQGETVEDNVRDSNLANETMESIRFRIHKIKLKLEDEGKTVRTIHSFSDFNRIL